MFWYNWRVWSEGAVVWYAPSVLGYMVPWYFEHGNTLLGSTAIAITMAIGNCHGYR